MDGLQPELAAQLPTLLHVRNALYSQRFRTFIEEVRTVAAACHTIALVAGTARAPPPHPNRSPAGCSVS
jgi:hypothetical protein